MKEENDRKKEKKIEQPSQHQISFLSLSLALRSPMLLIIFSYYTKFIRSFLESQKKKKKNHSSSTLSRLRYTTIYTHTLHTSSAPLSLAGDGGEEGGGGECRIYDNLKTGLLNST